MKVSELKSELSKRALPVTGNKTELIERLTKIYNASESADGKRALQDFSQTSPGTTNQTHQIPIAAHAPVSLTPVLPITQSPSNPSLSTTHIPISQLPLPLSTPTHLPLPAQIPIAQLIAQTSITSQTNQAPQPRKSGRGGKREGAGRKKKVLQIVYQLLIRLLLQKKLPQL